MANFKVRQIPLFDTSVGVCIGAAQNIHDSTYYAYIDWWVGEDFYSDSVDFVNDAQMAKDYVNDISDETLARIIGSQSLPSIQEIKLILPDDIKPN